MPRHSVAQYTNADAQTTVKANVEVGDLKAPTKVLDMNTQRVEDVGAPDSDDDAPRRDTIDSKITTHTGVAGAHHAKYTNAEAIAAGKTDTALLNPSGMIIIWHGTIATIPSGWVICDGNNSTPNLLTRFIEGVATAATNPGATGGATAKTTAGHIHTMPTHTHTYTPNSETTNYDAGATILPADNTQATTDPRDPGDANINTDGIADIRPLFYDIAFLMKT